MVKLIKFFLIWYSQNMAIPFWVIGHIHLSINIYKDWQEYGSSIIMNLIVFVGFLMDFKENKK